MLEISEREDTILKLFRRVLDAELVTDRAEAERAVRVMEELFSRFPANPV